MSLCFLAMFKIIEWRKSEFLHQYSFSCYTSLLFCPICSVHALFCKHFQNSASNTSYFEKLKLLAATLKKEGTF